MERTLGGLGGRIRRVKTLGIIGGVVCWGKDPGGRGGRIRGVRTPGVFGGVVCVGVRDPGWTWG